MGAVEGNFVDKGGEPLKNLKKLAGNGCGKKDRLSTDFHGWKMGDRFPQSMLESFLFGLWKTWGKVLKLGQKFVGIIWWS